MRHLMVDLETLAATPDAAILSIGAVEFDRVIGRGFYRTVDLRSCLDAGLKIDISTIQWWMQQEDDARKRLFAIGGTALSQVLEIMTAFWLETQAEYIWCHGATFDVPILTSAYKAFNIAPPWNFRNIRDTRTLFDLFPFDKSIVNPWKHSAFDDAKTQALWVMDCLETYETETHRKFG